MPITTRTNITHKAKRNVKIFRAYLAEEYDGIGLYVMVSLSPASTSVAIKAQVTAGDFGRGVNFPVGTPVVAYTSRGFTEILGLGLGNV